MLNHMLNKLRNYKNNTIGTCSDFLDSIRKFLSSISFLSVLIYSLAFAYIVYFRNTHVLPLRIFAFVLVGISILDCCFQRFDKYNIYSNFISNLTRILLLVASIILLYFSLSSIWCFIKDDGIGILYTGLMNGTKKEVFFKILKFLIIPLSTIYGLYAAIKRYLSRPDYKTYSVYNSKRNKIIHKNDEYEDVDTIRDVFPYLLQMVVGFFTTKNFTFVLSACANILNNFAISEDGKFLKFFVPLLFSLTLILYSGVYSFLNSAIKVIYSVKVG
ncbi:hypothetical protein SLOPH_870 [Spraguea lophii 42_110]|uniref:Uncharacterized protein n=1 Tax=Spraguea lophii (strain 42_110) TaxID=1358809 RepID=S7XLW4_SPRLO|nr:hypothetical protein SLOPH_870 [Spraguea lophii 42_110]